MIVPKRCPNCEDVGFTVFLDGYGDYEQEQCEFCHTVPDSVFNVARQLTATRAELEAKDAELGPLRNMRETVSMAYRLLRKGRNDASKRWMRKLLREWIKATAAQKRTQSTKDE